MYSEHTDFFPVIAPIGAEFMSSATSESTAAMGVSMADLLSTNTSDMD